MHSSHHLRVILRRKYSSAARFPASDIRTTFTNYFVNEHSHKLVPSSSVIPHNDASLAFVNAGMNQFKSVLLGIETPPAPRVANSQKCIRVGGKHNDLDAVGKDGTHHTFFEMLGNWSFSDYFKEDACKFAWNLMTGPYGLDKKKLVVTYFGGNVTSKLKADIECADVWRQLGLDKNQIIPNGMADNFWEMGPVGPCGPCTEIYYIDDDKIMELWNLVFIEYERKDDGQLYLLENKHVDTGMGLERISRVLQGVQTNYDTDLFRPLFEIIQKSSRKSAYTGSFDVGADADTAYRILADHSRAIAVSLADGIFPTQNHKLRRLVKRCFSLSEGIFSTNGNDLLSSLITGVAESLGETYPELRLNLKRSIDVIEREYDSFKELKLQSHSEWEKVLMTHPELQDLPNDHPGLVKAVNHVKGLKEISGSVAFHLQDSLGLDLELIRKLANCLNLKLDVDEFNKLFNEKKQGSRVSTGSLEKLLLGEKVPQSNDQSKYFWEYQNGNYNFSKNLQCKVVALVKDTTVVDHVSKGDECILVTDHTHLYHEAGGQASDTGTFHTPNCHLEILNVQKEGKYVLHYVRVVKGSLATGESGKLNFNETHRLQCMQNHSATHLLNAALHKLFPNTYQRSSSVTHDHLTFDFSVRGTLKDDQIAFIEDFVRSQIKAAIPIKRTSVNLSDLPTDTIKIPGEAYPDSVFLISMSGDSPVSSEPCCGTHCNNTFDIIDFCITAEKSAGSGVRSLRALSGNSAIAAVQVGKALERKVEMLQEYLDSQNYHSFEGHKKIKEIKQNLTDSDIPLLQKKMLRELVEKMELKVDSDNKVFAREAVDKHVKQCLLSCKSNFVVSLLTSTCPEPLPLIKGNSMSLPDKASIFLSIDGDGFVRARCAVPQAMVSDSFNAEAWMVSVTKVLNGVASAPKGKDIKLVCLMKPNKLEPTDCKKLCEKAVKEAENFATASLLLSALQSAQQ